LVGQDTSDDAAVYKLSEELAVIVTLDFFTPMVDDPYLFGQIAAANSLSDVYAMGGKPLLALNIACLPNCLSTETISAIMRGGADKVLEAGALIAGGHTVQDEEPKYGLAVVGLVHPDQILTNAAAKPGDLLLLTKPLGTGIISAAQKGGLVSKHTWQRATEQMASLNKEAAHCAITCGANSCTDITGFGFLGHAAEMAKASGVTLFIDSEAIPLINETKEMAKMGLIPAGAYHNRNYLEAGISFSPGVSREMQDILYDPQTSGGLLIATAPDKAKKMLLQLQEHGLSETAIVGRVEPVGEKLIMVG
jgi:selenide,water dikinase